MWGLTRAAYQKRRNLDNGASRSATLASKEACPYYVVHKKQFECVLSLEVGFLQISRIDLHMKRGFFSRNLLPPKTMLPSKKAAVLRSLSLLRRQPVSRKSPIIHTYDLHSHAYTRSALHLVFASALLLQVPIAFLHRHLQALCTYGDGPDPPKSCSLSGRSDVSACCRFHPASARCSSRLPQEHLQGAARYAVLGNSAQTAGHRLVRLLQAFVTTTCNQPLSSAKARHQRRIVDFGRILDSTASPAFATYSFVYSCSFFTEVSQVALPTDPHHPVPHVVSTCPGLLWR